MVRIKTAAEGKSVGNLSEMIPQRERVGFQVVIFCCSSVREPRRGSGRGGEVPGSRFDPPAGLAPRRVRAEGQEDPRNCQSIGPPPIGSPVLRPGAAAARPRRLPRGPAHNAQILPTPGE